MKNIARIDEMHRLREENAELHRSLGERWSVIAELREENCLLEKVRDALAKKLNETVSERDALLQTRYCDGCRRTRRGVR